LNLKISLLYEATRQIGIKKGVTVRDRRDT